MEEFKNDRINKILKQTIVIYYVLMIIYVSILGVMMYSILHRGWIFWYILIFVLLHIQWLFFDIKTKFLKDRYFVPQYYVFMFTYMFPAVLILWQISVYSVLLLYILLPLIIMFRYYASKYMAFAVGYSLFCILAVIITSAKTQILQADVDQAMVAKLNVIIIIASMGFIIVFFYFYHQILKQLKDKITIPDEEEKKTPVAENAQLKELYNNIIAYFEKKQPYRQPNYRLSTLAADLDTNTKYISEAIKINFEGTFDALLNKYRLQYAKKMLDEGLADKYTMEYIYTTSGYLNRSTFYKNFYKTFNMTPSEYHNMKNTKNMMYQ